MFQRHFSSFLRILVLLLAFSLWIGQPKAKGQNVSPGVDFFSGVDFNFRDINYKTQYEFLIRLNPGFKWNMGNHWQLSGQVLIPIVNQYGTEYGFSQINILNVSKEFKISNLYLKATAGAFSQGIYGLDMKAFLPMCDWFAFEGQAGYIGWFLIYPDLWIGAPNRFVGTFGGDFYLPQWNTQFRCVVGKYMYRDFGFEVEAMRHFNHTTASIYGRWSNNEGFDAGFKFIIALPPYHRKHRAVNIRPISNFRSSYTVMYHVYSNRMYKTDPEENERDGWFSHDFLQWGSHTMKPDFIIKDLRKPKNDNNEKP